MKKYKFCDIEFVRIVYGSIKWRADHPELGSIGWGETKRECMLEAINNIEYYNSPRCEERRKREMKIENEKELIRRCYNCWKEVDSILKRMRNNDNEDDFKILEKLLYEYKDSGKSLYKKIKEEHLTSEFKNYAQKRFWEECKKKKARLFHKWLDNFNKQSEISVKILSSCEQDEIDRLDKTFKIHYEEMESAHREIGEEGLLDEFNVWLEGK